MKVVYYLIFCFFCFFGPGSIAIHPAVAQDAPADPLISLTAKNEPLGEVLETITRDTGYRFNLNRKWNDHPVSATIGNLPLEQGLKRLLRSLNHTIIWEADKIITIMVFGKADPGRSGPVISFQSPPQTYQEETEPAAETENASADEPEPSGTVVEAAVSDTADQDEANREPGDDASTPEADTPDEPSAESAEGSPSAADAPTDGAETHN